MNIQRLRPGLAVASLLFASPIAAQNLTIRYKVTGTIGNVETTSTQYITPEYSRSSSNDTDSIVHFPTGRMTMADHRKKEYWEATIEEMDGFWDRNARELRRSGMADMFDLREEPRLEKIPGKKSFAGYDCEHWDLSIGEAFDADFWAAPGLHAPPRYYEGRRLSAAAMGPLGQLMQKMYEQLKTVKGFPLSTAIIIRTPFSRTQTLEEAIEVKKGAIPASTFEVPSGYKKIESPFAK